MNVGDRVVVMNHDDQEAYHGKVVARFETGIRRYLTVQDDAMAEEHDVPESMVRPEVQPNG